MVVVVGGSGVCISKIGKFKSTMDDIAPIAADDEKEVRNAKCKTAAHRKSYMKLLHIIRLTEK